MKKKLLRGLICFLLSVVMITEYNLGAVTVMASEITEEGTQEEGNQENPEETKEEENEENTGEEEKIEAK